MQQKHFKKEVDEILQFYNLELSFNRSNAKEKPEMKCLFELLRSKIEKDTLSTIFKSSKSLRRMYKEQG